MGRRLALLLALAAAWLPQAAHAQEQVIDCRAAAEFAELAEGLPTGLLLAIGKIETGRPDPATGQIEPWPWSTNQGGQSHFFSAAQDAIAWTAMQQARGLSSIDVGCFQINLLYHPDAFASLDEAFDPIGNALYAARFLSSLYRRTGGWPLAVAQYHSADPSLGGPYGARVYSAWGGDGGPSTLSSGIIRTGSVMTGTWPGGSGRTFATARIAAMADPVAIRISMQALGVRVVLPSWATASRSSLPPMPPTTGARPYPAASSRGLGSSSTGAAPGVDIGYVRVMRGSHLPQVYRPSG